MQYFRRPSGTRSRNTNENKYHDKLCVCENEEPTDLYGYKVDTPWVTYDSSDDDEELEIEAAATARKIAAANAAEEAAALRREYPDFRGPATIAEAYSDEYFTSDDSDDDQNMQPVAGAAPVVTSTVLARRAELNQI